MKTEPEAKVIIPAKSPDEEEPWRWRRTKEGYLALVPTRERVRPNKYKPRLGRTLKSPSCFNVGPIQLGCKSCMWRYSCTTQVR